MAKRTATTDVNHDNWDKEEDPEEPGVFQKANDEILQRRVIKTAKRRTALAGGTGSKASPFSSFSGFGSTELSSVGLPFSFLNQNKKSSTESANKADEGSSSPNFPKETESQAKTSASSSIFSSSQPKDSSSSNFFTNTADKNAKLSDNSIKTVDSVLNKGDSGKETDKKSQNLESLKDLNLSCNSWITEHLEKNPYCILTPIFRDYEKHLAQLDLETELDKKENSFKLPTSNPNSSNECQKPFFFSKENTETASKEVKPFEFKIDKEPGKLQFDGPKKTFPFTGFFSPSTETTINLNVGGSTQKEGDEEEEEESSEPPKSDFTPVVEEDSTYDKRCKIFFKKDSTFIPKGVGTLFLKPVKNSKNTQLVVRADTSSGNILLNVLLTSSIPVQKTGKNNIMIVCVPTPESEPPPIPVLIRVKTSDDCDELIKKLEECKGS